MTNWTAQKLRAKYLEFFQNKGHAVIPSASLIPENDPTALFISAGMHPLVPFLKGEAHPAGKRLVDFQRCLRTSDIDEVGDDSHLTFFEMLGNWSLGDYFKEKAIAWSWEFLTGKEWLALDPERIYVTCFAGDEHASRDEESAAIWKSLGVPEKHIAFLGREDNWWGPAGEVGPCGPDTEMFYKVSDGGDQRPDGVTWPPGSYFEIWNDVFMEYEKLADGGFAPLSQKNVDTGMGLERALVVLQKVNNIYETELFQELMDRVAKESKEYQSISARIVADHARASVFIAADGVIPSNKEQGYVLRKLIRKTVREFRKLGLDDTMLEQLLRLIIHQYQEVYPHVAESSDSIVKTITEEAGKFRKTLAKGEKFLAKELSSIKEKPQEAGKFAFDLYQTYGFPPEMSFEILTKEEGLSIEDYVFDGLYQDYLKRHQEMSRAGSKEKFAGGLADHSERVVRMHTATHLLHQALRDVLGDHVYQKGSNITAERLRFDFTHPRPVTDDELRRVEVCVNEKVQAAMEVTKKFLPLEEARKLGAIGLFGEKYGDTVSVYLMGDYSKEFCGGPHVNNTKEVGKFSITKEEAVSAGVRRIKAMVV